MKIAFFKSCPPFFSGNPRNPICNPEPPPAAPLGVVARPCRARQPERHGETLSAGGQDLVRDVLGVHKKIIPLEFHWSPWSFYVTLDGMDFFMFKRMIGHFSSLETIKSMISLWFIQMGSRGKIQSPACDVEPRGVGTDDQWSFSDDPILI